MPINARLVDTEQAATNARTHLLSYIEGIAWFAKVTNTLKIVFTWKFVKYNPQFQLIKREIMTGAWVQKSYMFSPQIR
jgi:hypothetical protein